MGYMPGNSDWLSVPGKISAPDLATPQLALFDFRTSSSRFRRGALRTLALFGFEAGKGTLRLECPSLRHEKFGGDGDEKWALQPGQPRIAIYFLALPPGCGCQNQ